MTRATIAAAVVALATTACATTQQEPIAYYDADDDDLVTDVEYAMAADEIGYFDRWDIDGDGFLEFDEYRTGMVEYGYDVTTFEVWDENDDDLLTRDELYRGTFVVLDTDRDRMLNADEMGSAVEAGYGWNVDSFRDES